MASQAAVPETVETAHALSIKLNVLISDEIISIFS
jgi:hypothetical protein